MVRVEIHICMRLRKTPHTSQLHVSYGVPIMRIWERVEPLLGDPTILLGYIYCYHMIGITFLCIYLSTNLSTLCIYKSRSSLIQIMARHLVGTKPLSEQMLEYC